MSKLAPEHGAPLDIKAIEDDGTFTGYASVFGVKDNHGDIVLPGSFTSSLSRRPAAKVKMLWQHRQDMPIGKWDSIVEDGHGLKVRGRLVLDIEEGRRAHTLMKSGIVDQLSIGFRTVRDRYDKTKGARLIEEADLWEISPVTFASNPDAEISSVKNHNASVSELVAAINAARANL